MRQRRRLALCFLLGASAGALLASGQPGDALLASGQPGDALLGHLPAPGPSGTPGPVVLGALAGGSLVATLAAAAILAAPGWRWFALKFAAVFLLAALAWRVAGTPPQATVAGAAAALLLLPSQPAFLDRLRVPFITRARVERRLDLSAEALWDALRPVPRDRHWDPHVRAVRQGPRPDVLIYVHAPLGDEEGRELPVQILDLEPGHFKARDLSLPAAGQGGPVTVASVTVEPDGHGARLTLMEASWRQGLWTAFALWLDDYLGDHVDRMAALLGGRRDRSIRGAMLGAAQARGRRKPTRS